MCHSYLNNKIRKHFLDLTRLLVELIFSAKVLIRTLSCFNARTFVRIYISLSIVLWVLEDIINRVQRILTSRAQPRSQGLLRFQDGGGVDAGNEVE